MLNAKMDANKYLFILSWLSLLSLLLITFIRLSLWRCWFILFKAVKYCLLESSLPSLSLLLFLGLNLLWVDFIENLLILFCTETGVMGSKYVIENEQISKIPRYW